MLIRALLQPEAQLQRSVARQTVTRTAGFRRLRPGYEKVLPSPYRSASAADALGVPNRTKGDAAEVCGVPWAVTHLERVTRAASPPEFGDEAARPAQRLPARLNRMPTMSPVSIAASVLTHRAAAMSCALPSIA